MHKLVNWSATRSGPCMTVKGRALDAGSPEVRVSGVYRIAARDGRIFAENGVGHRVAELLQG